VSYEPAEDGGHDPQRVSARPLSRRWPRPWQLRLPRVDDGGPGPGRYAFPVRPPLERRAEHSKLTPYGAHSLATRPGTPVRFTLRAVTCAGRESNPHAR